MKTGLWGAVALAVASLICASPAQATAFAGVDYAFWNADFFEYTTEPDGDFVYGQPDGIIGGGGDAATLTLINNHAAYVQKNLVSKTDLSVTNTSNEDFLGTFTLRLIYSGFNPGGSVIGASVTNPLKEYAGFTSWIFGPHPEYPDGVNIDFHSCDTIHGDYNGDFVGPNACGVSSPDSSETLLYFGPLAAGQTITVPFEIGIHLVARGVPEPLTLSIFSAGLAGLAMARRRGRKAGGTRRLV